MPEPRAVHTNDRLLPATSAAARADGDGGRQTKGRTPSVVLLLTIEEAAVALAVPRSWLRDKVTARQVPHTRLGRHVRFSQEHLRQIIEMGEEVADIGPVPTEGSASGRQGTRDRFERERDQPAAPAR